MTDASRASSENRAVLFADIGGSTRLYDMLGDVEARRIAADLIAMITKEVVAHAGIVIKTIGDEVMSTFPNSDKASQAACAIQQAMTNRPAPDQQLGIHVGFHFGNVLVEHGDVFGDVVNVAARMVGLAKTGQILTTRQTVDAMTHEHGSQTRQIDRRAVKGKNDQLEIFEVIWQAAGLTTLTPIVQLDEDKSGRKLVLSFLNTTYEVSAARPALTIGRDVQNDVVLPDPRASRFHARIEDRQGKFVLFDTSTNGTLVKSTNGKPIFLRREELILTDTGRITVGEVPSEGEEPLEFQFS